MSAIAPREALLRRGYLLALATVAWNIFEGVVAILAGTRAQSVALVGFGVDSFIETASGLVVGWRLRQELIGGPGGDAEAVERKASRIAGGLLLLLALYIVVDAGRRLAGFGERAEGSVLGIALTAVSLALMPLLGRAKLRTAEGLKSRALRADAFETIACAWLSLTTLAGLVANAALGWWWADPLAAFALVPLIVREGWEGWKGPEENRDD